MGSIADSLRETFFGLRTERKTEPIPFIGRKLKPKAAVKLLTLEIQTRKNMNINTERALLIKELQQVEDISLLKAIKAVLYYGLKSEGRISVEQYNRELDEAEAEIDRGEFTTHESLKQQMKAW